MILSFVCQNKCNCIEDINVLQDCRQTSELKKILTPFIKTLERVSKVKELQVNYII